MGEAYRDIAKHFAQVSALVAATWGLRKLVSRGGSNSEQSTFTFTMIFCMYLLIAILQLQRITKTTLLESIMPEDLHLQTAKLLMDCQGFREANPIGSFPIQSPSFRLQHPTGYKIISSHRMRTSHSRNMSLKQWWVAAL